MPEVREYPQDRLLIRVEWLAEHLEDPDLQVVDVRAPMPQLEVGHPWGHIPGAVHLDLNRIFSGRATGVRGSLGPPDRVAAELERSGLVPSATTVVYDGPGGAAAAQAFWLFESLDFPDVRWLEGGFAGWRAEGHPVSTEQSPGSSQSPELAVRADADRTVTLDRLRARLDDPNLALVDARTPGEYEQGHIPGAVLVPWERTLETGRVWRLLSDTELRRLFEAVGATPDRDIVTYCQTGARSAHIYFVLRLLDYPSVRNYDGSWEEWGAQPDTPKER